MSSLGLEILIGGVMLQLALINVTLVRICKALEGGQA